MKNHTGAQAGIEFSQNRQFHFGVHFKSILGPNMGSKRVPNRIINPESIRNALDRHLGRSWAHPGGSRPAQGDGPGATIEIDKMRAGPTLPIWGPGTPP